MIKQVLREDEIVQTGLAVDVDGTRVYYKREDDFSYLFWFTLDDTMTAEDCKEIIDKIVNAMEHQSYDHGAEWRETYRQASFDEMEHYGTYSCRVYFRVRDAG